MAMNSNTGCGNQKVARSILFTLRAHLFFFLSLDEGILPEDLVTVISNLATKNISA